MRYHIVLRAKRHLGHVLLDRDEGQERFRKEQREPQRPLCEVVSTENPPGVPRRDQDGALVERAAVKRAYGEGARALFVDDIERRTIRKVISYSAKRNSLLGGNPGTRRFDAAVGVDPKA